MLVLIAYMIDPETSSTNMVYLMKMLRAYVIDPSTSSTNMKGDSPSAVPRLKFFTIWGTLAPRYVTVIPHPSPCPISTVLPALHDTREVN